MVDRSIIELQKRRAAAARVGTTPRIETSARRNIPAQGSDRSGSAYRALHFGVHFPRDMAEQLRAIATEHGISFSEAVRRACKRGLAADAVDTATGTPADD